MGTQAQAKENTSSQPQASMVTIKDTLSLAPRVTDSAVPQVIQVVPSVAITTPHIEVGKFPNHLRALFKALNISISSLLRRWKWLREHSPRLLWTLPRDVTAHEFHFFLSQTLSHIFCSLTLHLYFNVGMFFPDLGWRTDLSNPCYSREIWEGNRQGQGHV